MAVVKNLMVRAGADFSGMRREMQKANKNLQDFKSGMNRTLKGIGATLATLGIGAIVKDAVKSAMDVEGSMQQINRTMGDSAQAFIDWAGKGAMAYNLAKSDALKYGQVYSNLTSLFSKSTAETMTRTQDLLKATGVIASSTGRGMTDVMERIRSGMLGNTEAIEDLGIYVNIAMIQSTEAFKRFANGKSWDQLNFQTQQQIRYFAILEQSTRKFGNAINDNASSRTAQFVAQLKNVQLGLGQAFLPIWNAVLPALTRMAAALASVMNVVAQFTQALFGKSDAAAKTQAQTQATTQQAGAVGDLGDAYKDAGKKAKGALAGFDEVNQLADSSGSAGSGSTAPQAGMPAMDPGVGAIGEATVKVSEKVREMANRVKAAFAEMSSFVTTHKDIILAAMGGLAAGFAAFFLVNNWSKIIAGIRTAFAGLAIAIGAISWEVVLIAAAVAAVVGAFIYFYRTNETFRGVVDGILKQIGVMAKWLWTDIMVPFGRWLADVMPKAWDAVKVAATWLWKNVMVPFGDFLVWLWKNVMVPMSAVMKDVFAVAFKILADIAKVFWKEVLVPLGDFFKASFGPAVEALTAVLKKLGEFIDKILKPILKAWADNLLIMWNQVLKPLALWLGDRFVATFKTVFTIIGDLIGQAKQIFIGLMDFITGVFTGNWEKAWNGVKSVFKGVFDSLWIIVKTPLNSIIDGVNALISGLNRIKINIPPWVAKMTGYTSFGINIPNIPRLAKGGITNGPMMAMIGDNPGGKEVVSPLDGLLDMIQSAVGTAIMAASQINNRPQGDVVFKVGDTELVRFITPFLEKEKNRIGGTMIRTT